ncbi:MAG: excinuclease ABC subunit C [Sphingobacteriales bacterium]|nr:excinuclease ABC subunit C [Sphingobacteriales bacterium]
MNNHQSPLAIYHQIQSALPDEPGVYRFLNHIGTVIYVGKAKSLKKRVASYFVSYPQQQQGKTRVMVSHIADIQFTVVESEQDALLLENTLIKQLQPRYNVLLKDDKTYPYICIKKEEFPRLILTRHFRRDGSEYLGPFPSMHQAAEILEFLKKSFPLRTCNLLLTPENIRKKKFRPCLEYHIGNCKAPCAALQSEADYLHIISQLRHILKGNVAGVLRELQQEMTKAATDLDFEKAQYLKEKANLLGNYQSKSTVVNPTLHNIDVFGVAADDKYFIVNYLRIANGSIIQTKALELVPQLEESPESLLLIAMQELRLQSNSHSEEILVPFEVEFPEKNTKVNVPKLGDKKKLLDLAVRNALYYKQQKWLKQGEKNYAQRSFDTLNQLKKDLRLTEIPLHIECFDNSNFQGSYPVASMVCFKEGKPAKSEYRHFNIKTVTGIDDFASMSEIVWRRYRRLLDEEKPLPQLVIIDGGKGQLQAAMQSIEQLELNGKFAIVGIAKRLEEIYVPKDSVPLYIDKKSPSLKLLQQIRNEAHRFAITFHRQQRSKGTLQSQLLEIPGIGEAKAEKLWQHFKSLKKIKAADAVALRAVVDAKSAQAVLAYFSATKT